MDGPTVEHSDSDSGESWTLLENSVYADEPPEFIEDTEKQGAQHHDKDDDTDGISIISDSDHEAPSPTPADTIFEKCHVHENLIAEKGISDYVSVDPHLTNLNDDDTDPEITEDFLGDSHARHKTYVHRRNKRLSTVLNIIVLGSVITAAGVAIGHMWGAKNDCTLQTTTSVNKILSNLYKLQEENAYLRSKIKELTKANNLHMQDKIPLKYTKCKKIFEESLSNYDSRKLTKCVDENNKKGDLSFNYNIKPKFEKEFIADIDKLKTVYLQNKSWLDEEISRRMKIEEELLQKYKDEVNLAKGQKKDSVGQKYDSGFKEIDAQIPKQETMENLKNMENEIYVPNKVTYADSLKAKEKPRYKRYEERYENDEDNSWLTSGLYYDNYKINDNYLSESVQKNHKLIKQNLVGNSEEKPEFRRNEELYGSNNDNSFIKPHETLLEDIRAEEKPKFPEERYRNDNDNSYIKEQETKTKENPGFQRNEERYVSDNDNSFIKVQQADEFRLHKKSTFQRNEDRYESDGEDWSTYGRDTKNLRKKEKNTKKQSKQTAEVGKNNSNERTAPQYSISEDEVTKDNRYVINKLKKEKKKNGYINSNKKQKRRNKFEKLNKKGEFGQKFETVVNTEDFDFNFPDKNPNFDYTSFTINNDATDKSSDFYKDGMGKPGKLLDKKERKGDSSEQDANWYEKRAIFRTEARKKYYAQLKETSPNNSSWYFRRMRKREQCRARGNNSTSGNVHKEKKNHKMKH